MLRNHLQRSLAPRAVVALSRLRTRAWSGRVRVELYFAYDDPYAAIALPELLRLTRARGVALQLYPLCERGIPNDPAAEQRRLYSVIDADRLAQRERRRLIRQQPLAAADCEFLALWTAAAHGNAAVADFAAAAITHLWLHSTGPLQREAYVQLHRRILGCEPPADDASEPLRLQHNARRLRAKGHWESPAARIDGEWFFAHERLLQMAERIDQRLGKTR